MTRERWRRVGSAGFGVGAVVLVAGTFAPWLRSGEVTRNSYRTAGLMRRLLGTGGFPGAALDALPLLGVICALLVVLVIAGSTRWAFAIGTVLALAMAALAVAALTAPESHGVRVDASGPMIVLVGSAVMIVAAMGSMIVICPALEKIDEHPE